MADDGLLAGLGIVGVGLLGVVAWLVTSDSSSTSSTSTPTVPDSFYEPVESPDPTTETSGSGSDTSLTLSDLPSGDSISGVTGTLGVDYTGDDNLAELRDTDTGD